MTDKPTMPPKPCPPCPVCGSDETGWHNEARHPLQTIRCRRKGCTAISGPHKRAERALADADDPGLCETAWTYLHMDIALDALRALTANETRSVTKEDR
jgi:hypothetical protein